MDKITLGRVDVVYAPNERVLAPLKAGNELRSQQVALEELQQMAGFAVPMPAYLPTPLPELVEAQILSTGTPVPRVASVILKYRRAPRQWLVLVLSPNPETRTIRLPYALTEGRIGSQPAALYQHTLGADPTSQSTVQHCLWEHGDLMVEVQTPWLSASEVALVGQSLRP